MKNFILPITILIAFLYLASSQVKRSAAIYREGAALLQVKEAAEAELKKEGTSSLRELALMQNESLLKDAMLERWSDLTNYDSFEVNRELDNIISRYGCLPSNSSNSAEDLIFDGIKYKTHVFRTTILGDFKSVLSVIGAIELTYPTAMISELIMSESISGVTCKLSVSIPELKNDVNQ